MTAELEHVIIKQRMTPRARAYIATASGRHLLLGLACMLRPQDFTSKSFDVIKGLLGFLEPNHMMVVWGVAFIIVGLIGAVAATSGREEVARLALQGSVVTTALWAAGFGVSILAGSSAGWSGVIIWTAVTIKDITMLRDPLRNPFEDLVKHKDEPRTEGK